MEEIHTEARKDFIRDGAIVKGAMSDLVLFLDTLANLALPRDLLTKAAEFLIGDAKMVGAAENQEAFHKTGMMHFVHCLDYVETDGGGDTRAVLVEKTSGTEDIMGDGFAILDAFPYGAKGWIYIIDPILLENRNLGGLSDRWRERGRRKRWFLNLRSRRVWFR